MEVKWQLQITTEPEEKIYLQVTETLEGTETCKSELAPLYDIRYNHEKIVLSMDKSNIFSVDDI